MTTRTTRLHSLLLRLLPAVLATPLACLAAAPPELPPYPVMQIPKSVQWRDVGLAVALSDDAFLLAGRMTSRPDTATWGWMVKTDAAGNRIWEKELGKKAQDAYFEAGVASGDGALLVGGVNSAGGMNSHSTAWIVCVAGDGHVVWDKALDFGKNSSANHVLRADDGSFLVVGTGSDSTGGDQTWVVQMDGAGHVARQYFLAMPKDLQKTQLKQVARAPGGGLLVVADYYVGPGKGMRGWLGRFDADGKLAWSQLLHQDGNFEVAIDVGPDGTIVLASHPWKEDPIVVDRRSATGKPLGEPVKTGLCSMPTLWRRQNGQLGLAGLACPGARAKTSIVGLVADVAHPERLQKTDAIPGGSVITLLPLPARNAILVQGFLPTKNVGRSTLVTLPTP